jgi:imidazolonepropionase-like amidohydrolase
VYKGATIIDGNGGAPIADAVLVTSDGRILAVGPVGQVNIPSNAREVDLGGKFIMPGLVDANVHLVPWPSWNYIEFLARYEHRLEDIILEGAQLALKGGVTTVFDTMGPLLPLKTVRDGINRGEMEGARMFVAGNILGFRAVFSTPEARASASKAFQARINRLFEANGGPELNWLAPDALYAAVRRYIDQGVDFIKYGATGDGEPVDSISGQWAALRFTPAQQRAIVRAAHDAGVIVQAHQTTAHALDVVVQSGADMTQHCSFIGPTHISNQTLAAMKAAGFSCGTQWAPLSEEQKTQLASGNIEQGKSLGSLKAEMRMLAAGIPMLMSTDAGTIDPDVAQDWGPNGQGGLGGWSALIGEAEYVNMAAMLDRGMKPMMVIQAATRNVAAAYQVLDKLGTLEQGKYADFLVLDIDPLTRLREIQHHIHMVVKEGRVVKRESLPRHPVLSADAARTPGDIRRQ